MMRDSAFRTSHGPERPGGDRRPRRKRLSRRDHASHRPDAPPKQGDDLSSEASPQEAIGHLPEKQPPSPFREAALFYDPPYASLMADRLARQLVRYLEPSCGLQHETIALTPRNCFRLDFLIEASDDVSGVARAGLLLGERPEAEGAPALYDALVVGSGAVDVLFRFDPEGLDAHLADALFLMCEHTPALFERPERLQAEASRGPCSGTLRGPEVRLSYPTPPVDVRAGEFPEQPEEQPDLVVRRLSAAEPAAWAEDYRRALRHFGIPESQHRPPAALQRRRAA